MSYPHDINTEKALLSCLLSAGTRGKTDIIDDAVAEFRENPFFQPKHRHIWKAIKELAADSKPIESPSVLKKLREMDVLEQIGGQEYLLEIYSNEVSAKNWRFYAQKATELLNARRTMEIASELTKAAQDPNAAQELPVLLNDAIAKVSGFYESKAETKPIRDVLMRRLKHYEDAMNSGGKLEGITTGIPPLDAKIRGLRPGNMVVISAATKGGKSALAINIMFNAAEAGNPVGLFSMEMNEGEIADRLIASAGNFDISTTAFSGPTTGMMDKIRKATTKVAMCKIFIRDESVMNTLQFRAAARKLVAREGCRLLIVDYVQLMDPTDPKASRERQVADASRTIKTTAQELGIPIIVLCQLNDDGRSRESRAIEQDANIFMRIEKDEEPRKEGPPPGPDDYILRIVLARDCQTGIIPMKFCKEHTKFTAP